MESTSIYAALAAVQSELKAPKGQMNTFGGYRYRSCEDILEAVKPILKAHDLLLTLSDEPKVLEGVALHRSHCKIGISGWWLHFREGIRKRAGAKNQDGRCTGDWNIQQLRPQVCPERPVLHRRYQGCRHGRVSCDRRSKPRRCEQAAEAACSEA